MPRRHDTSSRWGKTVWLSLSIAALAAAATQAAAERNRPNVVLIYTDDQDLDEIGCYGGRVPTPHMDGLGRDGMKFTRYYVCSAVCSPSRYNAYGADERHPGYFDQDQLYDLNRDPAERENLAGEPAAQARLAEMKNLLRRYSATLPHTFGEFKTE